MLLIRKYQASDCADLAELFYSTVHTANAKDYSKEQLDAWAPRSRNLKDWNRDFEKHISFVAIDDRTIVGFGDIEENGYLNKLEGAVQGNVFTHASITAKPFFEKRGYKVIKRQTVKRRGVLLTNFVMEYRR